MSRLFLDASVLFAAVASPSGGSARVLAESRQGRFEAVVSRLVLLEADRNIRKKLPSAALTRFHLILDTVPLRVVPPPSAEEIALHRLLINEKDALILAAAVASGARYLITLDRRHFMAERLRTAKLLLRIVTPGDLLQTHPE